MLIAVSALVPHKTSAAITEFASGSTDPSNAKSEKIELQRYARSGRGRGGGSRSRGARPSQRPSGGRPSNRPSGGRPGSGPSRPGGGGNINRNVNVNRNVNRNVNVSVKHRGYGWRGARWGAVVFGVTLGTAIIVAANTPPYPPDPSLCWTWSNSALTSGYWYYCDGP
jgi:hypothetical protein